MIYRLKFDHHTIGNEFTYRAIGKIALNYYLYIEKPKDIVPHFINYVTSGISDKAYVRFYYPLNKIYNPEEGELLNIILLKGDPRSELLYCYIEIFNITNFIVVLSDSYKDQAFTSQYCWNILKGEEVNKNIDLMLLIDPFCYQEKLEHVQENFMDCYDRFLRIIERVNRKRVAYYK